MKNTCLAIPVVGAISLAVIFPATGRDQEKPPYPQSTVIREVEFDWSTHERLAPGSDNWPITWADDGNQYAAWGDGGGFGGDDRAGRVSLGVARIEGTPDRMEGFNVWGGMDPDNPATFGGKSYGILSVDGVLYMWVSPGSGRENYEEARVHRSIDRGATWTSASWAFTRDEGMILPSFLQFGKNYAGARDSHVYIYASHLKAVDWSIQRPGEIALMRVPRENIMDRERYEFFVGRNESGSPVWTGEINRRKPVFIDSLGGVGSSTSVSYNPFLKRYLLMTEHGEFAGGNLGIYDAPNPWGPWTTVYRTDSFGVPHISETTFFWNFSNKWTSGIGPHFVMIFTGTKGNDSWNVVRGRFLLKTSAERLSRSFSSFEEGWIGGNELSGYG